MSTDKAKPQADELFSDDERLSLQYALTHLPIDGREKCNTIITAMAQERRSLRAIVSAAEAAGYARGRAHVVATARRISINPGAELLGSFADDIEDEALLDKVRDGSEA